MDSLTRETVRCVTNAGPIEQVDTPVRLTGSILTVIVLLVGCAPSAPKTTVTICDSSGCREQDRSVSTFVPEQSEKSEQLLVLEAKAAEEADAAFDLAMRLFRGEAGIPRDSYQALQWMRRAGDRGDVRAQLALGQLYMTGLEEMGVDLREAEKWLALAVGQGDAEAAELLAEVRPALADQRELDKHRERWNRRTYAYWYRSPVYYYYWDRDRRRYRYY